MHRLAQDHTMTALYIYYRVSSPCPVDLAPAVHAMQSRLRGEMPGLAASLHRRVDAPAADTTADAAGDTWMEIYQFNGHADQRAWSRLESALAAAVGQLPTGIDGLRHAERFELLTLPALHPSYKG